MWSSRARSRPDTRANRNLVPLTLAIEPDSSLPDQISATTGMSFCGPASVKPRAATTALSISCDRTVLIQRWVICSGLLQPPGPYHEQDTHGAAGFLFGARVSVRCRLPQRADALLVFLGRDPVLAAEDDG